MSQYSGVHYEVPAYATGTAPTAPMVPRTQSYNPHGDPNMDPDLTSMDPDLSQLLPATQRAGTDFLSSLQGQATPYQLQLQAAAANEAAIAGDLQGASMPGDLTARPPPETPKAKRLGRACDACSKRKVKCGEEVPCKNCLDLEIECTFSRPTKRRGPANRVAEDLKRQRTENGDGQSLGGQTTFAQTLGLDSIASHDKVSRLLFDFFTYLGPIYPFPPEALLLPRLERREDQQNKSLVALVSSMLAILATAFPRLIQEAAITMPNEDFIRQCTDLSWSSCSSPFESLEVDDAATYFFLGIVAHLNGRTREFAAHMRSSLSIIRALGVFSGDEMPSDGLVADPVTKEFSLRIFWSIYTTARSLTQTPEISTIIPFSRASALPSLPILSDTYNFIEDQFDGGSQEKSTLIEGLNILIRAHAAHHKLYTYYSLLEDEDRRSQHTSEAALINTCLQDLDVALSSAHPELSALPAHGYFEQQASELWSTPHLRAHIQTEILKIHLRSGLLQARLFLTEALADIESETSKQVTTQYVSIIKELSLLLRNLSPASIEPFRALITPIIRGLTLALRDRAIGIEDAAEEYEYLSLRFVELFGES